MRHPMKWSVLLASLLFGFSFIAGTGVGAQESEEFNPADLEGLQYGVNRSYSIEFTASAPSSSAESTESTPEAEPVGLKTLDALVLEFDNDDNAEKGFDALTEQLGAEITAEDNVEEWDVDLGNKSTSLASSEELDGEITNVALTAIQEGNYIYLISSYGGDFDAQDVTRQFAEKVIEADGSGEGEFNEDGTSTGGLWDKLPTADDDLVSALPLTQDMIFFPEADDSDA